jgi:galactokinase
MAEHGINLFACADLRVQDTPDGRKIILADSAYFKADKEKMRRLLEAAGYDAGQIERIVENINDPLGVPVVIEFTRPVRCHSVWFHAFNTKLPEAEDVDAHVIQPRLSETLCYGKAFYGDIYEGKAPAPPQREIFMDRDTVGSTYGGWDKMPAELKEYLEQHPELCPAAVSEEERKQEIREAILSLCKETGEKSVRLISPVSFNKPEYESGGRGQEYFIYDEGGGIIESNVEKAVQHGLDVLKVDDLVLQAGLPSYFDRLYSESAMERFVDLMATERSMGVPAYAPVYNYARDIVVLLTASKERIPHQDFKDRFGILPNPEGVIEVEGPEGIYYYYAVSHPMDIISIQPVGNAARHGRVLRHTPENIKERYRADHEFARRQSIAASLRAELVYMRENWKRMLADRMKHDPELGRNPRMLQYLSMEALDLPPSFFIIPYQMGDYKEEWLVDEHDRVVVVYDYTTSQFISVNDLEAFYDADGKTVPVNDQARQLFNDDGSQRVLYFRNPIQAREQGLDPESFRLRSMVMSKIEPNPGLGLWTPYAAEEAMAGGRGTAAFTVMFSFGQWWDMFRDWPGETTPAAIGPAPAAVPLVLVTQKYLETAEQRAVKMAAIQLGKEGPANEAVFKVEEVSVVLAFWMYLSGKTAIEVGDAHILKGAIRCEDAELLDKLLVSPDKQDYRDFIAEQIVPEMKWVSQQVGSEDFVPPAIMIAPDVLSEDEADSIFGTDRTNVAVVFNASYTTSQHGVEQLQRDANKALGLKKVNVLGVPKVSLRDDYKTNVAIASPQGRPVIYMLEKGLPINRIRPDNLGGLEGVSELQEHQELAEWAKEAGIPITCDAEHAALVSDKAATYKALEDIGFKAVSIPPYRLVSGETEARPAVESFGNSIVYIQPNNEGTEGRGAEAFNTADSAELENAVHHATEIVSSGNRALIRQSVGNLYYSDAETPEGVETDHRLVTLRINAGSNVQTSFARTGFAMVAKDTHASVTSTERGGTIEDINITLHKKLWYRDAAGQWQRFIPKSQEIRRIYSSAATTAEKFKQGLCGIDVVLEVNPEGRLLNTYLLDINARGVLRPANRILAQMPSDYKPEDHVMIAPREFWQQVAGASAAGDMVTKVLPQTMLDALYRWREVHQVKNQLRVLCGSKHEADIQDYADRCIRTIKEALTRGFASEDQPIILLSVPGRVKPIGNACDYAGALFDSAAMATIEDNIFVISPRNDGKIHLGTLYPDKYPDKDCRVTDAGLNPNHIIKDRYTWDEWFASVAEEDRPMPEGVIDRDPYWHSMPWAATAWLRGAELQKREEGLFEGGFNFFVGDSELSSGGGLSSSSSIFIAAILGLNELYHLNWTQEQLIDAGFAERGACGTWGGNADHAAIVLCRAAQIGRLKLEPVQIDEQIGLPEGLRMVIIDTGIDRTSVAPFVSDKIASEDGEPVTEEGLMKAVSQIKGRGSIGGLLGELYYKSFLREKGVEFDHLRDLVAGGKASNQVTEEEIIGYLRRIPAHIGKDELLAQLDTFAEQFLTPDLEVEQELIARLRTEIGKLTFPKDGLRLRGLICYFLASAARVHKFFEAAKANDIDAILTVVRAYHNGERIVSASHLPPPGAGQLVYMRPYDGTPKFPELWELPGVRERSLEPVDNFIDAVEAQMSVTGYNPGGANTPAIKYTVAGMILAAGLGGQVIFFVPDAQMEKFETVAKRNLSRMIAHHVFKPLLTWSQSIEGQQAERAKRLVDTVIKNPDLASSIKHLIDAQTPVDILTSLVEHHCSVTMKEYAPGECATVIAVPKAMAAAAGDGTVLARAKAAGEAAIVIGNESLNRQIMPQLGQMGFNPVLGFTDIESATAGIQQLKAAGNSIGLVVNNTGKDLTGTIAAGIGEARVVEVPDPSKLEDVIGSA